MELAHARAVLAVALSLLLVTLEAFLLGLLAPVTGGVIVGGLVVLCLVVALVSGDRGSREAARTTSWDRMLTDVTLLNSQIAHDSVGQQPLIRNREGRS